MKVSLNLCASHRTPEVWIAKMKNLILSAMAKSDPEH